MEKPSAFAPEGKVALTTENFPGVAYYFWAATLGSVAYYTDEFKPH